MGNTKRSPRTYKATDEVYDKARERAEKQQTKLATVLENVVIAYSRGMDIKAVIQGNGRGHAIDIFTEDFSIKLDKIKV